LGSLEEDGVTWTATPLSAPHDVDNPREVRRLLEAHPGEDPKRLMAEGRLLGQLMPLRAFGDARFKWTADEIRTRLEPFLQQRCVSRYYTTPPYLCATPEVAHRRLKPRDRFLVIASDGLWEFLSPKEVVQIVGAWKQGAVRATTDKRIWSF
jgi:pyruvate dehydrogenase phosphatase